MVKEIDKDTRTPQELARLFANTEYYMQLTPSQQELIIYLIRYPLEYRTARELNRETDTSNIGRNINILIEEGLVSKLTSDEIPKYGLVGRFRKVRRNCFYYRVDLGGVRRIISISNTVA